jgi:peptidoglycan-associated lipoprotein
MRAGRLLLSLIAALTLAGCGRTSSQTWEDLKTAGRYMQRGVDAMWGKDYESKMLTSDEEFVGPYEEDFVPLRESDIRGLYAATDAPLPQPRAIPGQKGLPLLDQFYAPSPSIAHLFSPVHFDTDEHVVRNKNELSQLLELAGYLKQHPHVFLVIDGHTDERASASYNMALGMRRSNFVRSFLVKHGVDLNRIFTVSHGKEDPIALGHTPDDWKQNRRSEFKIYEK